MRRAKIWRSLRWANLVLNVMEAWIGVAAIVGGFVYFYAPAALEQNAISHTIGFGLAVVWNALYLVSGVLILYGLLRPAPRAEILGLIALGTSTGINGVSVVSEFGVRGVSSAAVLLTLTAASCCRAWYVYESVRVWMERGPDDR